MHKATLKTGEQVAMKIQYPGVANSIESDLSNLERLVTITNILPPGQLMTCVYASMFCTETLVCGHNLVR